MLELELNPAICAALWGLCMGDGECRDGRGIWTRILQTGVEVGSIGKAGPQVPSMRTAKDPKVDKSSLGRSQETARTYPGDAQATLCLIQAASHILLVSTVTNANDCPPPVQSKHMIG